MPDQMSSPQIRRGADLFFRPNRIATVVAACIGKIGSPCSKSGGAVYPSIFAKNTRKKK